MRKLERFRLSDAFWQGVPTPEGSYLYGLKTKLSEHPDDARALEVLLHIVVKKKDMLRALTVIETLLDVQPSRLRWKFFRAQTLELLGNFQGARMAYQELVDLRPFSARFLQVNAKEINKSTDVS
jgi:Flp pilus assembly protein TadD